MERGFLLLLGSIVALAIVASVGAQLDPGYQEGEHQLQQQEPPRFQYLPGEGGRRRPQRRRGGGARRPGTKNREPLGSGPEDRFTPTADAEPPALPQQFAGAYDGDSSAAPGEPGIDYPIYSHIPVTSFSCQGKVAGYYADPETQCQVFHVCTPGGSTSNSFICPNGTLFNPAVRTCDWWPAVDCGSSTESLRLNHVGKRVKDKSEATQSLLGGPGTRIASQRTHNRQQQQQEPRQKFTNEIHSQDAFQDSGRQSIKFDRQEQNPRIFADPSPTQAPQTTRAYEKYTQGNRQEYNTVANIGSNTFRRRRPTGTKRLPNQSLKRNQFVRTTTPPVFKAEQNSVEGTYNSEPETQRTPANGNLIWPPRSQTVTRFDITSETLDFPSLRNTPSTTTYRTPTVTITNEPTPAFTRASIPSRKSRPKTNRVSFRVQDTLPFRETVTTNSPFTEEKEHKTTGTVTQATPISRPQIKIQPINVRLRQPPNIQFSFANEPTQPSSSPTPSHTTFDVPKSIVETTPRVEHFSGASETSKQPLENVILHNVPTFATFSENDRPVRPIVVGTSKPDENKFGSQKIVKTSPSGFMAPQPILESFEPLISDDAVPSQSNSAKEINTPENNQGFSPSIVASIAQSFAGSTSGLSDSPGVRTSVSQAFAQSGAFSDDLQYSGGEDFTPFFTGLAGLNAHELTGSNEPQNSVIDEVAPKLENTESGSLASAFAQSFASANAFATDEGSKSVSTTAPLSTTPKATTFRPLNIVTVKATPRPTTTTIKPVYTPTVPQTTARPTTRPPKKVPSTTTTKPSTAVTTPSTVRTSVTPRPVPSTTASFPASTTTKKPKGFYITVAPPTRATTGHQPLEKDKPPKDNSPSYPSNTYFPTPAPSPITPQFSPSLFYPPTRPSYNIVPNSYFRSSTRTQYSPGNTGYASPEMKNSQTIPDSEAALDLIDIPVKSTSFEIQTIPDYLNGSGFQINSQATFDYRPQNSYDLQPNQLNLKNETEETKTNSNKLFQGTTEPPFVIQKSVELFAAHEVAYHPSVFSQTSYSLSSLQGDYTSGKNDQTDFQPPPYIEPSPNARGFGNWNSDDVEEKRTQDKFL